MSKIFKYSSFVDRDRLKKFKDNTALEITLKRMIGLTFNKNRYKKLALSKTNTMSTKTQQKPVMVKSDFIRLKAMLGSKNKADQELAIETISNYDVSKCKEFTLLLFKYCEYMELKDAWKAKPNLKKFIESTIDEPCTFDDVIEVMKKDGTHTNQELVDLIGEQMSEDLLYIITEYGYTFVKKLNVEISI
jgi:hypothetical protein